MASESPAITGAVAEPPGPTLGSTRNAAPGDGRLRRVMSAAGTVRDPSELVAEGVETGDALDTLTTGCAGAP
jgi:hypothetical protein